MKKLITGAVAALALLFGFASCSGDLHDSVVSNLYAEGDFNPSYIDKNGDRKMEKRSVFTMTDGSETEQICEFTYDSKIMTLWGGSKGTVNFKIVRDSTGWAKDWGGKKDIAINLSVNDSEWVDLEGRDAVNSNPGNIVINDLVDGVKYTLKVKYDAPAEKCSIKCSGNVVDYPALQVVFVSDDGTENTPVYMKRSGTKMSYSWQPETEGNFKYYIGNGYMYWNKDGDVSLTTKPSEDELNTVVVTKNKEGKIPSYLIEADCSALPKVTISYAGVEDTTILRTAGLAGATLGFPCTNNNLEKINETTYKFTYTFQSNTWVKDECMTKYETKTLESYPENTVDCFSILEVKNDWSKRWCGGKSNLVTIAVNGEPKELYYDTENKDPGHCVIVGLENGEKYTVTITIVDANTKKIKASVKKAE